MRQENGHGITACTAVDARGCRTPIQSTCMHGRMNGRSMALSESFPPSDGHRQAMAYTRGTLPARPSILRLQVLEIIDEVINDADTMPEARRGLLLRLQENPSHPEKALLAHLQDRKDQAAGPYP